MPVLVRLKQRADFIRIARVQCKQVMPGLILQAAPTIALQPIVRVGFTVSRKVGNAVKRNRIRRRLRAVAAAVLPNELQAGYDLVLIGRAEALGRLYGDLFADLQTAVRRLGISRHTGVNGAVLNKKGARREKTLLSLTAAQRSEDALV
ncbi:Ribonuclease P protein component [invertebrate metagenome]|uniref:Ribonuclease P protein component n=1 Tax=invertebrate metagenome TaxID=1711999 RepID=A0A484H6C0_9ZZZZ